MGTYLSTPVTDKETESGTASNNTASVEYGVVSMQGWRKSMEDAHIVQTDVLPPGAAAVEDATTKDKTSNSESAALVFCIFDGHGGSEVARFCQLYFIDVLIHQGEWRANQKKDNYNNNREGGNVGRALKNCFHGLDELLADPRHRNEIKHLQTEKPDPLERRTVAGFIAHDDVDSMTADGSTAGSGGGGDAAASVSTISSSSTKQEESVALPEDSSIALLRRMLTIAAAREQAGVGGVEKDAEEENGAASASKEGTEVIDLSGAAVDMKFHPSSSSDTDSETSATSEASSSEDGTFRASKILNGRQVNKNTLPHTHMSWWILSLKKSVHDTPIDFLYHILSLIFFVRYAPCRNIQSMPDVPPSVPWWKMECSQ